MVTTLKSGAPSMEQTMKTFHQNRSCKFCGTPIADQDHALRQFCERLTLPDGSIRSCKDDYWAQLRKQSQDPYQNIIKYYKEIHDILVNSWRMNYKHLTMTDLDNLGVDLTKCLRLKINEDGTFSHYYLGFEIIIDPKINHAILKQNDSAIF